MVQKHKVDDIMDPGGEVMQSPNPTAPKLFSYSESYN